MSIEVTEYIVKEPIKIIIISENKIIEFLKLKKIIDNSNFDYLKIKSLFYFKSKRWDIEINDGVLIRLPNEYSTETFDFVKKIIKDKNFKDKKYIDIRQKSQVIMK